MWDTDEMPTDMPLEEWLWITGQTYKPKHNPYDESQQEEVNAAREQCSNSLGCLVIVKGISMKRRIQENESGDCYF